MTNHGGSEQFMMAGNQVKLPPGPRGKWWPTWQLIRDPRRALSHWTQRYGDPFLLRALNGPVVVTGRSELIKQIFGANPDHLGVFATQTTASILGAGSLLVMQGEPHRRERRLLTPLFTGERMKAYGDTMREVALRRTHQHQGGNPFLMMDTTTEISLEIIVRAVFGGQQPEVVDQMFRAAKRLVDRSSPLIFFSNKMQFRCGGWSPWDRYLAARDQLFKALDHELNRAESIDSERSDILYLLKQATYEDGSQIADSHLRESLATLLFAGHETSALAMAWAMYHLHRHPDVLAKLKDSLAAADDSPEAYAANHWLKAVVQESLRLNPIVTEVLRVALEPLALGDYVIPAGLAVAPAIVLAHYNPETYPDPEAFRPERFLERSFSPFEFLPFGGGHRRCIGAAFATYEMQIVLGTLIRNFEFELLETRPVGVRRRSVTMGPSTGIAMRVSRAL
ncbi:MAG TPA: cytochrome P450 [Pirellulaceae bacterium]|nr:cytochrome P450 [Pirellulaceae bacterium]